MYIHTYIHYIHTYIHTRLMAMYATCTSHMYILHASKLTYLHIHQMYGHIMVSNTYYIHTYMHTYIRCMAMDACCACLIVGGQVRTYIHTYIHTFIHTHIHIHTYIHTDLIVEGQVRTYIHTYIHTYGFFGLGDYTCILYNKHAYTHTYIHTYIHTTHTDVRS
jgi:hypothetical protein